MLATHHCGRVPQGQGGIIDSNPREYTMTDRQTLLSAALGVGAICATVTGSSCSINARIDDLQANLLDFRAEVRSEIRSVREEIQDVRSLLIDHIDGHDQGGPDD